MSLYSYTKKIVEKKPFAATATIFVVVVILFFPLFKVNVLCEKKRHIRRKIACGVEIAMIVTSMTKGINCGV